MTVAQYLAKRDKKLAAVIRRVHPHLLRKREKMGVGLPPFKLQRNYFRSLAESIISQQLSGKAADTITARFVKLFRKPGSRSSAGAKRGARTAELSLPGKPFPTAQDVLAISPAKIRGTGVSGAKVKYLKDLARHVKDKRLDFHKFPKWTDEEVIQHLTAVHGIGRWTAEMFLMFSLGRPDVFSTGDQGLKNAIRKLYGFKKEPTAKQMMKLAEVWRPHRSAASRYLWKSLTLPD